VFDALEPGGDLLQSAHPAEEGIERKQKRPSQRSVSIVEADNPSTRNSPLRKRVSAT
jgi:hypothetical protein